MFSIVRSHGLRFTAAREVMLLAASMAVAEFFYKFHSFTLECLAFLGTWFVLSSAWSLVLGPPRKDATGTAGHVPTQ